VVRQSALADEFLEVEAEPEAVGPRTDDELYAYVLKHLGIDIPRTAACADHEAPFQAFADLYFERDLEALWLAPRGGAKTFMAAIWELLSSRFRPGCESLSVAATLEQARRGYQHLTGFLRRDGEEGVDTSLKSETTWANASRVEIVPGSENAVRGPHPQHVFCDEQEQLEPTVWEASRLMSRSKPGIAAQDLVASTRARAHSQMDKLIAECEAAESTGIEPPYHLRRWCVLECGQRCEESSCDACSSIVKGKWDSGEPRTFADACGGKLRRASGWIPLSDLHRTFRTTSRAAWESEMECRRPSSEGLILPDFSRDRCCVRNYLPVPEVGPVYMSVDMGFENPTATIWVQFVTLNGKEIVADGYEGGDRKIPRRAFVVFDELFKARLSTAQYVALLKEKEASWQRETGNFRVAGRFYDVQASQAARDWAEHGVYLKNHVSGKNVARTTAFVRELADDGLLLVDASCVNTIRELESWHYDPYQDGVPHKRAGDDHCADALRYLIANVRRIEPAASPAASRRVVSRQQTGAGPSPWETRDVTSPASIGHFEGGPHFGEYERILGGGF
jgi:hypothetical protein